MIERDQHATQARNHHHPVVASGPCPHCGGGPRCSGTVTLDNTKLEDAYCGKCGKNWPSRPVKKNPR